MNIKKVLKVTAVALTSIIILIVISAYLTFISFLPSPQKMAQSLKSASTELSTIETNKPKVDQKNEIEQPENSNTPAALTNNSEKNSKDQVENIRNMLNEDPRDIRVCENLGQSKTTDNKASKEESFDLSKVFSEEMRQDSVVESYRFAVRKIFQDEAISPLLNELLDLSNQQISVQETDSYLKKINFYSRAAYAAASLYAKKSTFEDAGNRAQHLAIVAQIAALKPEFAKDETLLSFCKSLEQSMANSETVNVKEERADILKLISYAGLTPKDLDFDPSSFMKFQINNSDQGINFSLSSKE